MHWSHRPIQHYPKKLGANYLNKRTTTRKEQVYSCFSSYMRMIKPELCIRICYES